MEWNLLRNNICSYIFHALKNSDYQCTSDNVRRMYADADVEHTRDSCNLPVKVKVDSKVVS